jgi:hypothetical protein
MYNWNRSESSGFDPLSCQIKDFVKLVHAPSLLSLACRIKEEKKPNTGQIESYKNIN